MDEARLKELQAEHKITVDGIWGPITAAALDDVFHLETAIMGAFVNPGKTLISVATAEHMCDVAAKKMRLPPVFAEACKYALRLEPFRVVKNGVEFYDVISYKKRSSFRGILQIGSAYWEEGRANALELTGEDIGKYSNVYNVGHSIVCFMANSWRAAKVIRQKGFKVDPETLYVSHNQSWNFWSRGYAVSKSSQSEHAQRLLTKYERKMLERAA